MSATTFHSFAGDFTLLRRPPTPGLPLQAWDAADEYLLTAMQPQCAPEHRVLVVNDQFGALAVAVHGCQVHSWSDSITAHLATRDNLARNGIAANVALIPATTLPTGRFDCVLWRLPKAQALLQQQLAALRHCVDGATRVFAAGMVKHLAHDSAQWLSGLGTVTIEHAVKKARLFRVAPDAERSMPMPPQPEPTLTIADYDLRLEAGPNVFARDKFDIGARFFIEQFARLPRAERIADLGCGNGVLGILAQRSQPSAQLHFFDESYQAVAAATRNYADNDTGSSTGLAPMFSVDDGLSHYTGAPFDLILCNPPFHQGHSIGDHIAWQLFNQSRAQLRPGGELWIVGNRHLQYHLKLRKLFGNCRQIAANTKFVVLAARRETRAG